MAINKYFNLYQENDNEQSLTDNFFAEAVQMFGMDMMYLPRTLQKEDKIFGEDVLSAFKTHHEIEMYIEDVQGFGGEGDLFAKFGLSISDEVNLSCSRIRFGEATQLDRPLEGDLIYIPMTKTLFEIKFVEKEDQFYPNGTLPSYKIRCELFEYSYQEFDTDVPVIDDAMLGLQSDIDAQNEGSAEIEAEADEVIDFSEVSPFGNY